MRSVPQAGGAMTVWGPFPGQPLAAGVAVGPTGLYWVNQHYTTGAEGSLRRVPRP